MSRYTVNFQIKFQALLRCFMEFASNIQEMKLLKKLIQESSSSG